MEEPIDFIAGQDIQISADKSSYSIKLANTTKYKDKRIYLKQLIMYYSWYNVNASTYNNNTFGYIYDGTTYTVTLPDGYYQTSDLNNYLHLIMDVNGHYAIDDLGKKVYFISIVENALYYGMTLTCTLIPASLPTGWTAGSNLSWIGETMQLAFNSSDFNLLLGFSKATNYPATPQTSTYMVNSPHTPQISPVSSVAVNINLANSGNKYNNRANAVYYFSTGTTRYGDPIIIEPLRVDIADVYEGSNFNEIKMWFTDQANRPLPIRDTELIARFKLINK